MRLFDCYRDVHSEHGEDGILYFFVKSLNIRDRPHTFLNMSEIFNKRNMFLFCIKHLRFKSCVPLTHANGKVECTLSGVQELLRVIDSVYVLCINTYGVDYWMLDAYFRHCAEHQKPVIVLCKINANVPFDEKVTVPYTPVHKRSKLYGTTYTGASLGAIHQRIRHDYTFVGTTRNATFGVFVSNKYVIGKVSYDMYMFPHTIHAQKHVWPTLKRRFWVKTK